MRGLALVLGLCIGWTSYGQIDSSDAWARQKLNSLSAEEKIGQLFMVAAYSNRGDDHLDELKSLVKDSHIGGLIFFQGNVKEQINITNQLQQATDIPLMIGIDAEWGLNMRLEDAPGYPKQMMIAASRDPELMYNIAEQIAKEARAMGIHVNFAPVTDVNINPENPVIGIRSFGQKKELVTNMSRAYLKGLQDNGVLGVAKHFPGHGDTEFDSHLTLPTIIATKERIDSIELYPYKNLIGDGLRSVMAAHLNLPGLGMKPNTVSSLSSEIINGTLRENLGFDGLVFTDALNMKGVSDYYELGELELKALQAGNDVLLFSQDVKKASNYLMTALNDGRLEMSVLDQAVYRILKEKYRLGISDSIKLIDYDDVSEVMNDPRSELIYREAVSLSLTLLKNKDSLIPVQRLDTFSIAAVSVGNDDPLNPFLTGLDRYTGVDMHIIDNKPSSDQRNKLTKKLTKHDLIIIGVHANAIDQRHNYGITPQIVSLVREISVGHKVIVVVFGNPYSLDKFYGLKDIEAIVMAYENTPLIQDLTSQAIFGGIAFKGKLSVDASLWFKEGTGIETEAIRLQYTIPEALNLSRNHFNRIDSLMNNGIKEGAYPGGQLFIAKEGKVVWNKGYGHHTYKKTRPVSNRDIYDLASVTKIAATTSAVMYLTDQGKVSIDSTLGNYLPEYTKGTPYENVVIREMMSHQAGFFAWLPFYKKTMNGHKLKNTIYSKTYDEFHTKKVAKDLYINENWRDSIIYRIMKQPLSSRRKYKYSDFGFYLLHKIIEDITGIPYEDYVDSIFYKPLGMSTMTYNPLDKFSSIRITPTENDTLFRKQQIHGYVHDQGAAMMGGVSGHAGLFSNANDLGIMMQMFLQKGTYAGKQYISDSTLADFTRVQYKSNDNRRGAGFDKPVLKGSSGPTCDGCVSKESYGHTGFTGITAWVDPAEEVIYIFMSNRVYPIAENKKILRLNVRTDIQQEIYNAINKAKTTHGGD